MNKIKTIDLSYEKVENALKLYGTKEKTLRYSVWNTGRNQIKLVGSN